MKNRNSFFAKNDRWLSKVSIRDYEAGIATGFLLLGIYLSFGIISYLISYLLISFTFFGIHLINKRNEFWNFCLSLPLLGLIPSAIEVHKFITLVIICAVIQALSLIFIVDLVIHKEFAEFKSFSDKLAHFISYGAVSLVIYGLTHSYILAFCLTLVLNILYEIKDGLFRYEKWGHLGGDGFSWKDLVAGIIGSLAALSIVFLVFRIF